MRSAFLTATPYVLRAGESLDLIARRHGYRRWRVTYRSRCNRRLWSRRPLPDLIQPGDVIMLPPQTIDIREALQLRLQRLRLVRKRTEAQFDDYRRELDSEFEKIEDVGRTVDAVVEVLTAFKDLGTLCGKGFKAIEREGEELAAANRALAKDAIEFAFKPLEDFVLETFAREANDPELVRVMGSVLLFFASVVDAWNRVQLPFFVANVVAQLRAGASWSTAATLTPEDIRASASADIARTRAQALAVTDQRIRETERLLAQCRGEISTPLPISSGPEPRVIHLR